MVWDVEISNSEGNLKAGVPLCFIFQAKLFFSCGQMIMIMSYDYDQFIFSKKILKLKTFVSYSSNGLIKTNQYQMKLEIMIFHFQQL